MRRANRRRRRLARPTRRGGPRYQSAGGTSGSVEQRRRKRRLVPARRHEMPRLRRVARAALARGSNERASSSRLGSSARSRSVRPTAGEIGQGRQTRARSASSGVMAHLLDARRAPDLEPQIIARPIVVTTCCETVDTALKPEDAARCKLPRNLTFSVGFPWHMPCSTALSSVTAQRAARSRFALRRATRIGVY